MSKGVAIMSMSLDGYVADLNDGVAEVFAGLGAVLTGRRTFDVVTHLRYPVRKA